MYNLLVNQQKNLFPASSKHLPNLGEMLNPTIQHQGRNKGDDQPRPPSGGQDGISPTTSGRGSGGGRVGVEEGE